MMINSKSNPLTLNDKEYKRMLQDLFNAGSFSMIMEFPFFLTLLYFYLKDQSFNVYAILVGYTIALLSWIREPGRPALLGRMSNFPKQLSEYEQRLKHVILLLRTNTLMVLSTSPVLLFIFLSVLNKYPKTSGDRDVILFSFFISAMSTWLCVSTTVYLQVWYKLKKRTDLRIKMV